MPVFDCLSVSHFVSCFMYYFPLSSNMLLLIHSLFQSILVLLFPSLFLPSSLTQIYYVMFPMHFSSFFLSFFGHPTTGSGLYILSLHIGVYFKERASQKTQKYSVSRQYWQLMYSQENLGTLISGLICDSKLIFKAFQGVTYTFRHPVLR